MKLFFREFFKEFSKLSFLKKLSVFLLPVVLVVFAIVFIISLITTMIIMFPYMIFRGKHIALDLKLFFQNKSWIDVINYIHNFKKINFFELNFCSDLLFSSSQSEIRFTFKKEFEVLNIITGIKDEAKSYRFFSPFKFYFGGEDNFTELIFYKDDSRVEVEIEGETYIENTLQYKHLSQKNKLFLEKYLKFLHSLKDKNVDTSLKSLGFRVEIFVPNTPGGIRRKNTKKKSKFVLSPEGV